MDVMVVRRLALQSFIGFLVLTALLAIFSVAVGEFGELEARLVCTSLAISLASICAMACAAHMEKRRQVALGAGGVALAVAAAVAVIAGVWTKASDETYWKATASLVLLAFASAHAFVLWLPDLAPGQSWVQVAAALSIGLLAALIIGGIWHQAGLETYWRLTVVVAIVVALETVVIPILTRLRGDGERLDRRPLRLLRVADGIYADAAGRRYRVEPVPDHATPRAPEPD